MNKFLAFIAAAAMALCLPVSASFAQAVAVHRCGNELVMQRLAQRDPDGVAQLRAKREAEIAEVINAQASSSSAFQKHTVVSGCPIPVVFHIVVTNGQLAQMGGNAGVIDRVKTNLASLNRDYSRQNGDTGKIPAAFKSRYADVGLRFAIANTTNSKTIAPGIELMTLSSAIQYDVDSACSPVKMSGTGLPAWDVSKYFNIWVCNITDASSAGAILGVTVPPSLVGVHFSNTTHVYASNERGVTLSYLAIGVRTAPGDNYYSNIDLGRTLTHETGHFFELTHIWGDDGGKCPGDRDLSNHLIGFDDGFSDTPPQADFTDCSSGCPTFPKTDNCSNTSPGIMFMNYMDYSDDAFMQMFTTQQAAFMQSKVASGGESASLLQNCDLALSVNETSAGLAENISSWPNPAKDELHIRISNSVKPLSIELVNMVGQSVARISLNGATDYDMPTGRLPRGIYTLACRFESGLVTQKIVLE